MRRSGVLVLWCLGWIVAVGVLVGSPPSAAAQTSVVRCESQGGKRVQCPIAQNSQATLSRHLSDTPCVENQNWGMGNGYLWVANGCRAEFTVTQAAVVAPPARPVPVGVYGQQIRTCRAEADRRLPKYSGDQITVELSSRNGATTWFTWEAGPMSGRCEVAADGRLVQFVTNKPGEGPGYGPGYGNGGPSTMLTCESARTERKECPIPQGSRIRLVRQTSDNPCRLNDTYGQGPGYLWVAEGCRGQFEVYRMGPGNGPGTPGSVIQLACAAPTSNVQQNCPIPDGARARYVSQQSAQPCIVNQTYGITASYVWVSRGCRATFEVGTGGYAGGYPGAPTTLRITCESSGAARQQCPVEGVTSVRLIRQMSTNPCQLSRTFGAGFGHIWVSNGCRGEFEATVSPAGGGGMHGGNTAPERITCESSNGQRAECGFQRTGGQVALVRQLSTTPCTRNSTWGTINGNTIWVTRGCRAEFEVR